MARIDSVQGNNGIVFGNWKLHPLDERNWELCGLRDDGTWKPLGRYYSYNTLHLALQYAADRELKDGAYLEQMELLEALHEYAGIVDALKADLLAAIGGER